MKMLTMQSGKLNLRLSFPQIVLPLVEVIHIWSWVMLRSTVLVYLLIFSMYSFSFSNGCWVLGRNGVCKACRVASSLSLVYLLSCWILETQHLCCLIDTHNLLLDGQVDKLPSLFLCDSVVVSGHSIHKMNEVGMMFDWFSHQVSGQAINNFWLSIKIWLKSAFASLCIQH